MFDLFIIGISGIAILLYAFIMLRNGKWLATPLIEAAQDSINSVFFSIIIPFRNEENNLSGLLKSIDSIRYENTKLEVLLVDDQSSDSSRELIEEFISKTNKEVYLLESEGGKKKALNVGIEKAKGEYIFTSDADCTFGPHILEAYNGCIKSSQPLFVSGPVVFKHDHFRASVFALEFAGLQANTAYSISSSKPIMSNGANLCFKSSVYSDQKALEPDTPSGDDVFFLHHIKKVYGAKSIAYCKSRDAIVETNPPKSIAKYFNQRIRWTSKSKFYKDKDIIISALVVFAITFLIVANVLAGLISVDYLYIGLTLLLLKTIIDFISVRPYLRFINETKLVWYVVPTSVFTILVTPLIAILGQFVKVNWKGRRI
jgi:glycosyltransferase involved in cell wall biosynthesis